MIRRRRYLRPSRRFAFLVAVSIAGISVPAFARQQNSSSVSSSSSTGQLSQPERKNQQDDQDTKSKEPPSGTSNDRLLFTLPNFLTVENAGHIPALTTGQKFKVVARTSFDYVNFPWFGVLAGVSQAENSEPGYGQGARGYAKRYGSLFADGTIDNFMTSAILPSLLHQDPRYYQLGKGGFLHRTGYAISRTFVIRTDSGRSAFNYSEIAGSAISSGISNVYHPSGDRNFRNTLSVWATNLTWDTLTFAAKEFWPDLRRKLRKNKN